MAEKPPEKDGPSLLTTIGQFFVPPRDEARKAVEEVLSDPERVPGHVARRLAIMAGLAVGFPGWAAINIYTAFGKARQSIKEAPARRAAAEAAALAPYIKEQKRLSELERMQQAMAKAKATVANVRSLFELSGGNGANLRIGNKDPINVLSDVIVSFFPDKSIEGAALHTKLTGIINARSKPGEAPLSTESAFNQYIAAKIDSELAEAIFKEMVNRYKGAPPTNDLDEFVKKELRPLLLKIVKTQMAERKIAELNAQLSSVSNRMSRLGAAASGKIKFNEFQAVKNIAYAMDDVNPFTIDQSMMTAGQKERYQELVADAKELVGQIDQAEVEADDPAAIDQQAMLQQIMDQRFEP